MSAHPEPLWHFGLTGWPLGHSLSPAIHTAALRSLGLQGDYLLYPVPPLPEGEAALAGLLARLRPDISLPSELLHGLNVTIPHKQAVARLLEAAGSRLTPVAAATGAVNTLYWDGGRLVGDNTDAAGFIADLHAHLPGSPAARGALVLGAGGSARAVAYALAQDGWRVWVAARRDEQAGQLAGQFAGRITGEGGVQALPFADLLSGPPKPLDLLVNCTPLGMSPQVLGNPWPAGLPLPEGALVYDLVYNPAETALMRAARSAGLTACNGLGMLVEQAALAFERWTGLKPPRQALLEAALGALPG